MRDVTISDIERLRAGATDATGAITWRESYHPFGKLRLAPAANDNNTGYTGHLHDKYTSVVNHRWANLHG